MKEGWLDMVERAGVSEDQTHNRNSRDKEAHNCELPMRLKMQEIHSYLQMGLFLFINKSIMVKEIT